MLKQPKNDPKTMQKRSKNNAKTTQKRSKNNEKTMQKRCKNDPKTIQKRCKNDATCRNDHFRIVFHFLYFRLKIFLIKANFSIKKS